MNRFSGLSPAIRYLKSLCGLPDQRLRVGRPGTDRVFVARLSRDILYRACFIAALQAALGGRPAAAIRPGPFAVAAASGDH